jgi:hypothetical protein
MLRYLPETSPIGLKTISTTESDISRRRYESVHSDFSPDIEVDDHGLVVTYPAISEVSLASEGVATVPLQGEI